MDKYYKTIDKLMKAAFQRRVRRAWFDYKKRKAEKKKKRQSNADKNKLRRKFTMFNGNNPGLARLPTTFSKPNPDINKDKKEEKLVKDTEVKPPENETV